MHAVQRRNLIWQVSLGGILPESPVDLFVALPPVDEGLSKVLTSHFYLCVPLVPRRATSIPMFIEGCVRCASHRLVGERRCSTPAVDVDVFAHFSDGGVRTRHNCCMVFAQEYVASSLTSHGTRRDGEHLRVELDVLCRKWIVFVRPKSVGWLHSERAQVSEFFDGPDLMVVLLQIIWLPQRFWFQNSIVTGQWRPPTLCGIRIVLVVEIR